MGKLTEFKYSAIIDSTVLQTKVYLNGDSAKDSVETTQKSAQKEKKN